jgi:phosphoglycerate kinase
MKTIEHINFAGKRALIRVDFNVPMDSQYNITDDTRMRAALPTINKVIDDGGSVVLLSHLGRPLKKLNEDGSLNKQKFTLRHLVPHLSRLLATDILFADDCMSNEAFSKSSALKEGQILLLENTRFHKEEEKGGEAMAVKLAKHGDIFVNDAFGTAHRAHASTTLVAQSFDKAHKCFGYLMAAEVQNAQRVLTHPERPLTAILGGAKVSDKILILENLISIADNIIVGGGMAYTFFKAMGGDIGSSLCEHDKIDIAKNVLEKAKEKGVNIYLPSDSIAANAFDNTADTRHTKSDCIPDGWMGLDIGEQAIAEFKDVILASKTILWNGPMGVFEMDNFSKGTEAIAYAVAEASANGAFSLVGGGDSVAAVNKFQLSDKVSFVSTGGGAMLEFFEGKTLPGVAALL